MEIQQGITLGPTHQPGHGVKEAEAHSPFSHRQVVRAIDGMATFRVGSGGGRLSPRQGELKRNTPAKGNRNHLDCNQRETYVGALCFRRVISS